MSEKAETLWVDVFLICYSQYGNFQMAKEHADSALQQLIRAKAHV